MLKPLGKFALCLMVLSGSSQAEIVATLSCYVEVSAQLYDGTNIDPVSNWDNDSATGPTQPRYPVLHSLSCRVTELARKAGFEGVSLHTLRHSHASQLLSHGTPIPTVAKRLGHANANVTLSIYSHALEADELAAAKIWNDAMADVITANRSRKRKAS